MIIAQLRNTAMLLGLAALLAACSTTPPSTHYLLTAKLDQVPDAQSPAIGVGPIEIPEHLNRNTLVHRGPENELVIARQSRWAEPLEDGISRVVSLNLAGLVGTGNVRSFPWHPRRAPDYGVKLRILQLDASDAQAILVAEWVLYRPAEESDAIRRISRQSLPLDASRPIAPQLPAAQSELLYRLSEDIAAGISGMATGAGEP